MQRIFITHTVPQEKVLRYNLSVAASNFCHNLIDGGVFDKVYSILPTFVNGKIEQFPGLIYSPFRRNRLFRHIAPLAENVKLFFKIPSKSSIWFYNCTILNAPLIVMLMLFKPSVKQQMIILDYTPSKKPIERFFLWLTNKMDGTIQLADSPLFTVKNSVCLPGVVPMTTTRYPSITRITYDFMISGALGDNIAMLPMLLESFSRLPHLKLHITGMAPDPMLIEHYTAKYKNIVYHGMMDYDRYLQLFHDVSFMLSTRNPAYPENQCNFPSKIIEALLHNRIVISTLHYPQLNGILYHEVPAQIDGFCNAICKITQMSPEEQLAYANQSDEVKQRFNTEVWKINIMKIENS